VTAATAGHAGQFQRTSLGNPPAYAQAGTARIAVVRRLPELLQSMGIDADPILAGAGVARADFEEPETRVSYAQLEALLIECERRTGCDHFGLLLCERTGLDDMGLPGRVARCGTTVGEALEALVSTYNLSRGGGIISLVDGDPHARFVFAIAMGRTRDTRHYQMGAVAVAFNVLEDLCGPDWQAAEVRFAFRSPAGVRPFQRFFRAPVHFDADESVIVFERNWLAHRLPPVDEPFRRAVAAELRRTRERAFEDFPGLVRDIIRKRLSTGACSIDSASAMLSLHRRTLTAAWPPPATATLPCNSP
jgi:hypothetical protein